MLKSALTGGQSSTVPQCYLARARGVNHAGLLLDLLRESQTVDRRTRWADRGSRS